jgi:Uma2 family endonuclease
MENELSSQPRALLTPEEYLRIERAALYKSEYLNGEMVEMSRASREHNLIVTNIVASLGTQVFDRPYEVYPPVMRTKVSMTGLYTYPDVIVVGNEPVFEDRETDTLLNPIVLVEVLSRSTESYDRSRKFSHYRTMESLREYVLVSQDVCRVEQYLHQTDGNWLYAKTTDPNGYVEFESIACRISMSEIYHRVNLDTDSDQHA